MRDWSQGLQGGKSGLWKVIKHRQKKVMELSLSA